MTYRSRILFLGAFASSLGITAFSVQGCSGDDTVTPPPVEAGVLDTSVPPPVDAAKDVTDFNPCVTLGTDACVTKEPEAKWSPTVIALNLKNQPKTGYPNILVPFVNVTNNAANPPRKPDAFSPGTLPGLGCVGYKFPVADPRQPTGPGFTDGNMGDVTLTGFTGGKTVFDPPPHTPIPNPLTCKRSELIPASGLFGYSCNTPAAGPVDGFMAKTDLLSVSVAGGPDLQPWAAKAPPSPNESFAVTEDLFAVTGAMVDGSQDLTLHYNCGGVDGGAGGPCGMASVVAVIISTSDAGNPLPDAGGPPPTPFDFPNPKNSFGLIQCQDLLSFNTGSFTVPKALLAQLPTSWTHIRIVIGTLIASQGASPDGQHTVLAAGTALFGVSRK